MDTIAKPIRIEPAFEDREAVRALFYEQTHFQAAAAYLPDGSDDTGVPAAADAVLPWFRETWALGGEARVPGVEPILHNRHFMDAARAMLNTARIVPKTVVVNVNPPMPAGVPHVDVPSFRGATRENLALRLLIAMGASGLFESWRVVEAGAISWFYEGPGGAFDYWPEGPGGPMLSECPPFGNVAIVADNDRMYHRIARVGEPGCVPPRMSAVAQIRPASDGSWSIFERNELRAHYPPDTVRLSVLWKAEAIFTGQRYTREGSLSPERIIATLQSDLRHKGVVAELPSDPLNDIEWVTLVYQTYTRAAKAAAPPATASGRESSV